MVWKTWIEIYPALDPISIHHIIVNHTTKSSTPFPSYTSLYIILLYTSVVWKGSKWTYMHYSEFIFLFKDPNRKKSSVCYGTKESEMSIREQHSVSEVSDMYFYSVSMQLPMIVRHDVPWKLWHAFLCYLNFLYFCIG